MPMLDALEFRALVARLTINWANLESLFCPLTAVLLKTDVYRAEVVFYSYYGAAARLEFISRLIKMFIRNSAIKKRALSYLKRFRKLTALRNEFVHAVYQYPIGPQAKAGDPFEMIISVRFGGDFTGTDYVRFRRVDRSTLNELRQAGNACDTLNADLKKLLKSLGRYVRDSPPKPLHTHPGQEIPARRPARRNRRP